MKKEKKLLILSLVLLSLIVLNFVLVFAQDTGTTNPSNNDLSGSSQRIDQYTTDTFFGRWLHSSLDKLDAKLIMGLMMFIVLLILFQSMGLGFGTSLLLSIPASFILVAYVTPDSILGIFRTYQTLPLVFATFLPLAILFSLTYLSVIKGSRTLITTQWLLWLIYLVFSCVKALVAYLAYLDAIPKAYNAIITYMNFPQAGTEQLLWFYLALAIDVIVAGIMVIGSGKFMNWAVLKTAGMTDAASAAKFYQAKNALKHLSDLEKDLSK
jgi:hypothetical protein